MSHTLCAVHPGPHMGRPHPGPHMGRPHPGPHMGRPHPGPHMGRLHPGPHMGRPHPGPHMGRPHPHVTILQSTSCLSIEALFMHRLLSGWVGHVIRMFETHPSLQIPLWRTNQWASTYWWSKVKVKDHLEVVLRSCNIPCASLEDVSADTTTWRSTCHATGGPHAISEWSTQKLHGQQPVKNSQFHGQLQQECKPPPTSTWRWDTLSYLWEEVCFGIWT